MTERSGERIRVVVADDHPLFRDGLVGAFQASGDMNVVGQAGDAASAVAVAREHVPDVAVLDVNMPGDGLRAARDISVACPATRILMLTVSEDEDDILAAMKAGASGYALKGIPASQLVDVVRSIAAGEVYIAPSLAWTMIREMSRPRAGGPLDELSTREREVLELVASGLTNAEIGGKLGLTEKTVKHYMTNVLGKLQVSSRVEAALLARNMAVPPKNRHPRS